MAPLTEEFVFRAILAPLLLFQVHPAASYWLLLLIASPAPLSLFSERLRT